MGEACFFILDSPSTASLTLRDYSKVVAGYKPSFHGKAFKEKPISPEAVWRFHAVTASPVV
jgi:hypothetical protein